MTYYDRSGAEISAGDWAAKSEDKDYKSIAIERVGTYRVSTVWLGIDHRYCKEGPPTIFETMVFDGDGFTDRYCDRYTTENDARAGHARAVAGVRDCTLELY
jgi:hypothetical protein